MPAAEPESVGEDNSSSTSGTAGTDANDTLSGTDGDDVFEGRLGNDQLSGGQGNDTYIYVGGQDVITETAGNDTVRFEAGITFNDVGRGLTKRGNDLILIVAGGPNQVTIKNFFLGGGNTVDRFEFATGGHFTAAQIFGAFGLAMPQASYSMPEQDTIGGNRGLAWVASSHASPDFVI
tara:strand:+ start:2443 stop:2976 length:534 start_codon:yes stop_codon:yes gene_type:complete